MFTDNSTGTCKWTSVKNPSRNFRWMLHETVLSLIVAGNSFRCHTETISVSVCRREATGTSLHGVSRENELFEAPGQVSCSCLMKHERFLRILYIPPPTLLSGREVEVWGQGRSQSLRQLCSRPQNKNNRPKQPCPLLRLCFAPHLTCLQILFKF